MSMCHTCTTRGTGTVQPHRTEPRPLQSRQTRPLHSSPCCQQAQPAGCGRGTPQPSPPPPPPPPGFAAPSPEELGVCCQLCHELFVCALLQHDAQVNIKVLEDHTRVALSSPGGTQGGAAAFVSVWEAGRRVCVCVWHGVVWCSVVW